MVCSVFLDFGTGRSVVFKLLPEAMYGLPAKSSFFFTKASVTTFISFKTTNLIGPDTIQIIATLY